MISWLTFSEKPSVSAPLPTRSEVKKEKKFQISTSYSKMVLSMKSSHEKERKGNERWEKSSTYFTCTIYKQGTDEKTRSFASKKENRK